MEEQGGGEWKELGEGETEGAVGFFTEREVFMPPLWEVVTRVAGIPLPLNTQ